MKNTILFTISTLALLFAVFTYVKADNPNAITYLASKVYNVHGETIYKFVDPDNNATCYIESGTNNNNGLTKSIACVPFVK